MTADDPAAEHVLHGCQEEKALAGLNVLDIAQPELIGGWAAKPAVDQSAVDEGSAGSRVVVGRPSRLPPAPRAAGISGAIRFLATPATLLALSSRIGGAPYA